jgi:hypothetical protein
MLLYVVCHVEYEIVRDLFARSIAVYEFSSALSSTTESYRIEVLDFIVLRSWWELDEGTNVDGV